MKTLRHRINKIVIVGASGMGKDTLQTLIDCNKKLKKYEVIGFLDDNKSLWGRNVLDYRILGGIEWFESKKSKDVSCVVAIGDCYIRKLVISKLKKYKIKYSTIIHPSTIISDSTKIGEGTIIQAGSIVMPGGEIGQHVIVNIDSTIGHECFLDDFVTISPGVHVSGNNTIHEGTYLGTGTVTKDKITIGKWSITGAGAVIVNDVQSFSLYTGVPGKLKRIIKSKKDRPRL